MDIIYITNKGKMLNIMENFCIYKETRNDYKIKDNCTIKLNIIFYTLILKDTDRVHITL